MHYKQTIYQFVLTALLITAVHISYALFQLGRLETVSLLPLAIDGGVLSLALLVVISTKWATIRLGFGENFLLSRLPSTLTFFLLGYCALLMLVYAAYTGDRFNVSLFNYFLANSKDLSEAVVAETGYLPLFVVFAMFIVSGIILHRAHQLSRQHLMLIFLSLILSMLLTSSYASSQGKLKIYAFFAPAQNPILPKSEKDPTPLPAWFKSFYLTMFGWGHGAYQKSEESLPDINYSFPSYLRHEGNQPNILLLVMESVRASATSPYADSLPIENLTPNLHQLAQSGILVEHAYTTIPNTSKALVGIFCGQFARTDLATTQSNPGEIPGECLPKLLEHAGYKTAYFQSALGEFADRNGLIVNMGFQEHFTQEQLPNQSFEKLSYVGMDDYVMLMPAINWMISQKKSEKPFFLGMLTVVSHHPYAVPRNRNKIGQFASELTYRSYLKAVAYTDRYIGDLIKKMRQNGLLGNTIVIVTGDHGEAFGEHGPVFHNGTPHEEGLRVPLILYSEKHKSTSQHIDGLRSHLDILPTVMALTGTKFKGKIPGISLFDPVGHEVLGGVCLYTNHCAVGYKKNGEKFIYWYGRKPNELYQLSQDPFEKNNLIQSLNSAEENDEVRATFSHINAYATAYISPAQ
jgi:arylsulfatase A-like enzyme